MQELLKATTDLLAKLDDPNVGNPHFEIAALRRQKGLER